MEIVNETFNCTNYQKAHQCQLYKLCDRLHHLDSHFKDSSVVNVNIKT